VKEEEEEEGRSCYFAIDSFMHVRLFPRFAGR